MLTNIDPVTQRLGNISVCIFSAGKRERNRCELLNHCMNHVSKVSLTILPKRKKIHSRRDTVSTKENVA